MRGAFETVLAGGAEDEGAAGMAAGVAGGADGLTCTDSAPCGTDITGPAPRSVLAVVAVVTTREFEPRTRTSVTRTAALAPTAWPFTTFTWETIPSKGAGRLALARRS
jgi:hypothetical protein